MARKVHAAGEILLQCPLVLAAPLRQARWQSNKRERYGIPQEARVDAAAAVEAELGIEFVLIVNHARDLDALVFVQRVLKQTSRERVGVEHQVLADQPAG